MVINADKLLNKSSGRLAMQKAQQEKMIGGGPSNIVLSKKSIKGIEGIKINVIKIEDIFKGSLALDKKQLDDKKKATSKKRKEDIETKLETKPNVESGGKVKLPAAPRMGILDFIKNFIGNVLLGYFAVRLIKHLPKIMPILKFLGGAADFIINTGGFLLNGLATFLDIGYKAYDATRGFLKSFGGENFVKVFDAFNGAVGSVIEAAIIASIALASQGKDGVLDIGMDLLKDRLLGQGAQAATQAATSSGTSAAAGGGASTVGGTATQAGGLSAGAVAAVVAGAGLLSSALGEGAFQVRKFAVKPIQKLENDQKNDKNPFTRFGRGVALNMIRPLFGLFQTVGVLLDIVGAPFRYAIELLRFPFLSEEDKVKQAGNLAKFDARIREDFRKALNMVTLGFAFKEKGSFGNIYGNKGAQKEMMGKMQGGGITRGGKSAGRVKRTVSKGKYKRVLTPQKPSKTELKTEAFTKPENKTLKESTEELDKTKYFGPILAISSKIMNKEEPTDRDYQNVGLGINLLIAKGIQDGQLKGGIVAKFAGGGLVDPDVLSAAETGGDISNWVAKTFRGAIETGAQRTMRLMKEMKGMREIEEKKLLPPISGGPAGSSYATASSGEYGDILDLIASVEAAGGYDVVNRGKIPGLSAMTIAGARKAAMGTGGSGAMGRYQQMPQYVLTRAKSIGLNPDTDLFSPENQDKLAILLINGAGYKDWKAGKLTTEKFAYRLAGTWRGLPEGPSNLTYQDQYASGNKAHTTWDKVMGVLSGSKTSGSVASGQYSAGPMGKPIPSTGVINDREWNTGIPLSTLSTKNGQTFRVATVVSGQFKGFISDLEATGYKIKSIGGVRDAGTGGGSGPADPDYDKERYSHPYGASVDINPNQNPFGKSLVTDMPTNIAEIAAKHGLGWGGNFRSVKDAMHFSATQNEGGNRDFSFFKKFSKGGRVLKPTFAMLGEKGPEFVFDADTTAGLDRLAPQLLEKLNIAKTKPQLASILQSYASYDARSEASQTFIVQSPPPLSEGYSSDGDGGGSVAFMPIGGGDDPFSTLYQGG
jgi:hypothetical protein